MLGLEAYAIMPDYKQQTSKLKINKSKCFKEHVEISVLLKKSQKDQDKESL